MMLGHVGFANRPAARYGTTVVSDSSSSKSQRRRVLTILLLVALGLRLGWALSRPATDASIDALPDQREYLSLAQNLLHGKGLQFFDKRFDDVVYAFRTPGYPFFLAACGGNIRAARAAGAVLDTSTVLAGCLLAVLVAGNRRNSVFPLVAAAIVAFNPYLIYFSALLLSETLFTAMLVWAMVLLILGRGGRGPWRKTVLWLCGGLLLALSALVRPSAAGLPILLGILSVFVNRLNLPAYQGVPGSSRQMDRNAGSWRLPVGATMLVLLLLVLFPWALRNRNVLGRWIWLDTNSGFTLYDAYNPDATGGSDQSFIDREPELQVLGEVDRSEYLSRKATHYASTHWGRIWDLSWYKLARTWSPMPLSSEYGRPGLRFIALAYSLPFDLMVLVGLFWGNLPRSAKVFLLAPAIYFSVIHAVTIGSLRYRVPAEPALAVLAAGVVGAWGTGGQSWRRAQGP
jgi:hypothetical protein